MEYDIKIDEFKDKYYYKKGTKILHREDGPAIEWVTGDKSWLINGIYHRTDGPAKEWFNEGLKEWWVNGKRHRTDGPAVIFNNFNDWWIDGKRLSPEKSIILNKWWNNKNGL